MSPKITSDIAREEDMDRILEINRLEYGPNDVLATRDDFAWRHSQNPEGKAIIPVIRNQEDQVVGFIWIVPMRIRIRGEDFSSSMVSNLVIHPDHRNAIGYTKLMRCFDRVFEYQNIPLHYSFISEEAYQKQVIDKPQSVITIPVLAKIFDSNAVIDSYVKGNNKKRLLKLASMIASPMLFSKMRTSVNDSIVVKKYESFTSDFDKFWQEVRDDYPASVIRDRSFLNWRFAPVSGRQYDILVAESQEKLLGYVVLRCATIRGIEMGIVSDFMVVSNRLGRDAGLRLLNEAESWFRDNRMSLSVALMTRSSDQYRLLRQSGYIRLPKSLSPKTFRFGVYVHVDHIKSMTSLSAQDWFLTVADYESF